MQQRFFFQIFLLAQHVSGITMPIVRSSRVLYSGCCLWYFVLWFSSCWSGVELRVLCPVCRILQHPANRSPFKIGLIGSRETSVRNYRYSLCNNPEERSSQFFYLSRNVVLFSPNTHHHQQHISLLDSCRVLAAVFTIPVTRVPTLLGPNVAQITGML